MTDCCGTPMTITGGGTRCLPCEPCGGVHVTFMQCDKCGATARTPQLAHDLGTCRCVTQADGNPA